jgi:hypothetical protein
MLDIVRPVGKSEERARRIQSPPLPQTARRHVMDWIDFQKSTTAVREAQA